MLRHSGSFLSSGMGLNGGRTLMKASLVQGQAYGPFVLGSSCQLGVELCADLEREQLGLKREEQKLIREIKAAAAKNNTPTVRVLAKSLVRLRGQQARLQASAAQMRGISSSMVVRYRNIPLKTGMGQLLYAYCIAAQKSPWLVTSRALAPTCQELPLVHVLVDR